jgi:ubiquinone/menaquinone biosynthesis C-methylase UbiE
MKAKSVYGSIGRMTGFYDFLSGLIGYQKSVDSFVAQLPYEKDASLKVLDAGCGTGPYTLAILKRFPHARVFAFDANEHFVVRLKQRLMKAGVGARAVAMVGDVQAPPREVNEQTFDLIMTAGVLEYVPLEKTVKTLSGLLVPGGYFLNSPVKENTSGKLIAWLYGCKPYARQRNIEAFTKNGFEMPTPYLPWSFKELHIFQKVVNQE